MTVTRIVTEECPMCYGEGCPDCGATGTITHGPWHNCRFCGEEVCSCGVCQDYSGCRGYWDYYIRPYMEEQAAGL